MLTPAQILQAKATSAPAPTGATGTALPGQAMTPEQAKAWIGGTSAATTTAPQAPTSPTIGQDVAAQYAAGGQKIVSSISGGAKTIQQGMQSGNPLTVAKGLGETALGTASGAVQGVYAPITGAIGNIANKATDNPLVQAFSQLTPVSKNLDAWQKVADAYDKIANAHPDATRNLSDALNVAVGVAGGDMAADHPATPRGGERLNGLNPTTPARGTATPAEAFKGMTSDVTAGVKATVQGAKDLGTAAKEKVLGKPKAPLTEEAQAEKDQGDAHTVIENEMRANAAKYPSSVGKVLNQAETVRNTDPLSVLSMYEKGRALPTLVKGVAQTDKPVTFLKKQISTLAEIKNRLVATGKKKVSIDALQRAANTKIKSMSWSAAKKKAELAKVKGILKETGKSYPKGVPNNEMDLLKTEHASASKAYTKGITTPFSPDSHSIVGDVARDYVQKTAGDAPIEELNKLIASHYDAVALLHAMRGKVPHGGRLMTQLGSITGRMTGYAIGSAVGHPLLGLATGELGTTAIHEILGSHFISNPLKRILVNEMKGVDPKVRQQALDYLAGEEKKPSPNTSPKGRSPQSSQGEPKGVSSPQTTKAAKPGQAAKKGVTGLANTQGGFIKNPFYTEPTVEELATAHGGWKRTADKALFDEAIMHKDAATIHRMLPDVPQAYKDEFRARLQDILQNKSPIPPKGGGLAVPDKTALTSEFAKKTLGGRVKDALQNYLNNPKAGLAIEDVTHAGQKYDVGITSVKGSLTSATDHLVDAAQAAYAKGDFEGAQKLYNQALEGGTKVLADAFTNTGIKVKAKGVGLGIYKDSLEPNYDMTATVPRGKEDLFHYILSDVADNKFHQYSMLTYRQVGHDAPLGVTDAARGMSNEPAFRLTLERPLTAADVQQITSAAVQNDIPGLSVREGGKTIDIVNITSYNTDYAGFTQKATAFEQTLDKQGLVGRGEHTTQEIRFVGSDPGEGHGAASYDDVRSNFRTQNPGYFNIDESYQSKILEKLKYKQHVTPQELEQLAKSQDITPLERGVVLDAEAELRPDLFGAQKGTKIPVSKLAVTVEGKSLPITVSETDSYANYGFDNVGLDYNSGVNPPKTLVFESPVEHGNQGHFNNPKHIGHTRILVDEERNFDKTPSPAKDVLEVRKVGGVWGIFRKGEDSSKGAINTHSYDSDSEAKGALKAMPAQAPVTKIGYITEVQSDVFQKNSPEELAQRMSRTLKIGDEVRVGEHPGTLHVVRAPSESVGGNDLYTLEASDGSRTDQRRNDIELLSKDYTSQQQQFLHLARNGRYQDALLRGTLQELKKQGVETVRVVTPSSAAKIEGYVNDEGAAPYTQTNGEYFGQDEELSAGDTIDYGGTEYTVVDAYGDSITVAPSQKVNRFSHSDEQDYQAQSAWDDQAKGDFEEIAGKSDSVTPEQAQEVLDIKKESYFDWWGTSKILEKIAQGDEAWSMDKIEEAVVDKAREDPQDYEDIYGRNNVFQDGDTVYTVEGDTETFSQPREYSNGLGSDNADAIDPQLGRSKIDNEMRHEMNEANRHITANFDKTQATVLKGYVDLFERLQKIAKESNVKLNYVTGNEDSTWYELPLAKIKRNLF